MKKRFAALFALVLLTAFGAQGAFAHDDTHKDTRANSCDTYRRHDVNGKERDNHDKKGPGDRDLDKDVDTPEDLYLEDGNENTGGPRYGPRGHDFYVQAIGGSGFGAGGRDDPRHAAGEGGAVQGEVDVAALPSDVDFGVSSFSADDPLDPTHFKDTAVAACVSVADNKVDTGTQYVPTSMIPHP